LQIEIQILITTIIDIIVVLLLLVVECLFCFHFAMDKIHNLCDFSKCPSTEILCSFFQFVQIFLFWWTITFVYKTICGLL